MIRALASRSADRRPSLRAIALGAAAGLCIAIAGSPHEVIGLAFVGPGLLLLAIEAPPGASSMTRSLLAGLAAGLAANILAMSWVVDLLSFFGGFPLPLAIAVSLLLWLAQSLPFVIACGLASPMIRAGAPGWLALPAAWVLAGSSVPMLFPWRIGVSQVPGVLYVQAAELGGGALLDLLLALASCGLVAALRELPRSAIIAPASIGLAALIGPHVYGAIRVAEVGALRASAPTLRVGVVQPNLSIQERSDPGRVLANLALHHQLSRELEQHGAELVIWSETAYPFEIDRRDRTDAPVPEQRALGAGVRGPLLFGARTYARGHRFNSVLGLDRLGRFTGVYDKVHLMAFGEHAPFWDYFPTELQRRIPRGFSAGTEPGAVSIAGARVGALNCYEDLLEGHVRRTASLDPSFLASFSNDAWFRNSAAPHLHHMLARLRAVEVRRDLVRATNTGVSGHVLATGEDEHRTAVEERASFIAEVRLLDGTSTPYARTGDLVTPTVLVIWIAGIFALAYRAHASR